MSKTKSIIILSILALLIVFMSFITVVPLNKGELGIYDFESIVGYIKLGFDLEGGVYVVYDVEPVTEGEEVTDDKLNATVLRLQSLLQNKGYSEATVAIQRDVSDNKHVRVEVPDVQDPEDLLNLLGNPAEMAFVAHGHEEDYKEEGHEQYVYLTGADVESAFVTVDKDNNYAVGLKFNEAGKGKFATATQENVGKQISIVVDGETVSSPTVQTAITNGEAVITGSFTYADAEQLAMRISSGAFNVKLKTNQSGEVSSTLGENALRQSLIAGAIGIGIVMIFMILVYRKLGIIADIALLIYVLLYMLFMAIFPWVQLTLPGIAGIILSIGMAVDANIIIFERMRDEYMGNPGKSLDGTIFPQGFKKSFSAIIDSNITTLLGAIILWVVGTGAIVGFAMTLVIGVVLSFITAVFITRALLNLFLPLGKKSPRAYGLTTREGVGL